MKGEKKDDAYEETTQERREKEQQEKKQKPQVPLKELLGEEFKGVKEQDAINKVYKEQRGHVKAAFHRNIIGDIDIMWGDGTCGLSHILNQRRHRNEDAHQLLRTIGKVIKNGKIAPDKHESSRWCISYMGKRAIISTELRDEKSVCLLTGFFA